jgi:hypothetical protein
MEREKGWAREKEPQIGSESKHIENRSSIYPPGHEHKQIKSSIFSPTQVGPSPSVRAQYSPR